MYKKEIMMYIVMVAVFTIVAVIAGVMLENNRIYSKCMDNNSDQIRSEAIMICKQIVR